VEWELFEVGGSGFSKIPKFGFVMMFGLFLSLKTNCIRAQASTQKKAQSLLNIPI
jgi:hypothetical protein